MLIKFGKNKVKKCPNTGVILSKTLEVLYNIVPSACRILVNLQTKAYSVFV